MSIKKTINYVLIAVFCFWAIKVIVDYYNFNQNDNDVYVRDDSKVETTKSVICGVNDKNTAYFKDMAYLSSVVYDEEQKKKYKEWALLEEGGANKDDYDSNIIDGLKYAVWENKNNKTIAIVFRGTAGIIDIHANLHWLFKLLPFAIDQYEQLYVVLEKIIKKLEKQIQNKYKIVSAGHSLGGGLAQHSVYLRQEISRAYVFNSSPVTGWQDIPISMRDRNVKGSRIYRIHENGEVLEFLRLLMKAGYALNPRPNTDPHFKEYRFNFGAGGFIEQHGIRSIYEKFNEIKCDISAD